MRVAILMRVVGKASQHCTEPTRDRSEGAGEKLVAVWRNDFQLEGTRAETLRVLREGQDGPGDAKGEQ